MSLKYNLKRLAIALLRHNVQSSTNLPAFNQPTLLRALYFARLLSSVRNVEGAIVECGVGEGFGLAVWTALSMVEPNHRLIWAFDSFEGFPKLSKDSDNMSVEESLSEYKAFTIPYVLATLQQFGISRSDINRRIAFAKGYIPESLSLYDGKPVALINIDLDIYDSYKAALEFFWDRLAPGGIAMFDEYNKAGDIHKWPGAQKAINEFLDARNLRESLQRDPLYGNAYIQKPGLENRVQLVS